MLAWQAGSSQLPLKHSYIGTPTVRDVSKSLHAPLGPLSPGSAQQAIFKAGQEAQLTRGDRRGLYKPNKMFQVQCRRCGEVGSKAWHDSHHHLCAGISLLNGRYSKMQKRDMMVRKLREDEYRAAVKIQRTFRMFLARQMFSLKRKVSIFMAKKIQTCWRMKIARREKLRRKRQKSKLRVWGSLKTIAFLLCYSRKRRRAASFIQCRYRFRWKMKFEDSYRKCVKIQAVYRGFAGRKKAAKVRSWSALRRLIRVKEAIYRYKKKKKAILRLQMYRRSLQRMRLMRWAVNKVLEPRRAVQKIEGAYGRYRMRVSIRVLQGLSGNARTIQSSWRMRQARHTAQGIKFSSASSMIQRAYRLRQGRQTRKFMTAWRGSAVRRIVRWIRQCRIKRQARTTWRFIRHNMRTILDNNTLMRIERGWDGQHSVPEARRLFHSSMVTYWQPVLVQSGSTGLMVQRCRVVRLYDQYSSVIRQAFMRYSTDGVGSPEKVFRLSRAQFHKFCSDMGILELMKASTFNLDKEKPRNPTSAISLQRIGY